MQIGEILNIKTSGTFSKRAVGGTYVTSLALMGQYQISYYKYLSSFYTEPTPVVKITSPVDTARLYVYIYVITIIIITMARQPYMGLGLLFPRLRGLCAFAAVRDRLTGRAFQLDPDVNARAIWQ
jgi:hypothetical protein